MTMTAPAGGDIAARREDPGHWVLIESGSNQDFIFRTNRRRYAVGASHLLKNISTWVADAVAAAEGQGACVQSVVATSGKALLLVENPAAGQRIVEAVTARAVREAPGLDIWGYVEPAAPGEPMRRLNAVHAAHAELRWLRAQPAQRTPMAPFLAQCTFTGLPARSLRRSPSPAQPTPVSAQAAAVLDAAQGARKQLVRLVGGDDSVVPEGLEEQDDPQGDDLVNAGWVALVHADGNSIGDLVTSIEDPCALAEFSRELEEATKEALLGAVRSVVADSGASAKRWLLPLIVGGDDITVACDARFAVAFTRAYLTRFEQQTAARQVIADLATALWQRCHLTASAGIAVAKPKFPFSASYDLAQSLTHSAKEVKKHAGHRSAYDLHVLRDSVVRDLSQSRPGKVWHAGKEIDLVATPLLAPAGGDSTTTTPWERAHDDETVIKQVDAVLEGADEPLSASETRRLREALIAGGDTLARVKDRLAARAVTSGSNPFLLDDTANPTLTRWPVVLDMVDITRGTARHQQASPDDERTP